MPKLNTEHIKAVIDLINQGPYFRLLSMEVCELGMGYSKVEVNLENKHLNPFGGIHGGVYSSLIDTAAYWAVYCDVEENAGLVSLDLKVDFLAPIKDSHLIIEGKRIKAGKSICIAEAVIIDNQGRYLAHGTSKQMVTPGMQTITQAVSAMEYQSIPPKFIS
ncbi:MAG: PaaI family thioesterase [Firmicutes bacterium HGW-Firmicutes-15]|nr:MAG: PaaI family thioesterase [Firmicutes bacterium HGW-Firmicutes-15]